MYIYIYKISLNHREEKLNSDHMNVISMNFYGKGESKNWFESKKRKLERTQSRRQQSKYRLCWIVCHCHLSEDWLCQHASNERLQTMLTKRYTTFFDIARFVSSFLFFLLTNPYAEIASPSLSPISYWRKLSLLCKRLIGSVILYDIL